MTLAGKRVHGCREAQEASSGNHPPMILLFTASPTCTVPTSLPNTRTRYSFCMAQDHRERTSRGVTTSSAGAQTARSRNHSQLSAKAVETPRVDARGMRMARSVCTYRQPTVLIQCHFICVPHVAATASRLAAVAHAVASQDHVQRILQAALPEQHILHLGVHRQQGRLPQDLAQQHLGHGREQACRRRVPLQPRGDGPNVCLAAALRLLRQHCLQRRHVTTGRPQIHRRRERRNCCDARASFRPPNHVSEVCAVRDGAEPR